MKNPILWLVLGLLPLAAQTAKTKPKPPAPNPAVAPSEWPIVSLVVTGNKLYSREQILAASGLKIGQPAGKLDFEAARNRLLATAAFNSVGYEFGPDPGGKGYKGTFQISEVEQVYPYRFEELSVSDGELRAMLKREEPLFGDKIPGTKEVLARLTKEIGDFLGAKNFTEKLVSKLDPDPNANLVVVFRPARARAVVAQIKFLDSKVIQPEVLRNKLAEVAVGVPYTEPGIRQLLDSNVRPLYDARGLIRVTFPKLETAPAAAKDIDGLIVTVTVIEGPVYTLGTVRGDGSEDPSPADIVKLAKIKTGEPANFDEVRAGEDRVRKRLRRDGYIHATTTVERKIDDQKKTVDIVIHVIPGPQFVLGLLTIVGLDIETEPAIRKLWSIQGGKPFDSDYPDFFLNRIREEDLFEHLGNTRSERTIDEATHIVNVTLYFSKS